MPSSLITNPDPSAVDFLFWGVFCCSLYSLKKSSKGDPGGNWKGNGCCDCGLVSTTLVADIFTTEGINFSAKFAKLEGASFAKEWLLKNKIDKNKKTKVKVNFLLIK